jgi:uncharacterized membrane protein HdeD (DUF308 family)
MILVFTSSAIVYFVACYLSLNGVISIVDQKRLSSSDRSMFWLYQYRNTSFCQHPSKSLFAVVER